MPTEKREALITEDDSDRVLDALSFNAKRLLTRIAARQNLQQGMLYMVVEQSELGRVPPLTLVSVQLDAEDREVRDLDKDMRALITSELFQGRATETNLQRVTLRNKKNLHSVAIDVARISAHARMAALTQTRPAQPALAGAPS